MALYRVIKVCPLLFSSILNIIFQIFLSIHFHFIDGQWGRLGRLYVAEIPPQVKTKKSSLRNVCPFTLTKIYASKREKIDPKNVIRFGFTPSPPPLKSKCSAIYIFMWFQIIIRISIRRNIKNIFSGYLQPLPPTPCSFICTSISILSNYFQILWIASKYWYL